MFHVAAEDRAHRGRNDFLVLVGDSKDHLRESAHSAGNHAPRLARSLARWHVAVVQKLRIAPEPAAYAQRSCAAVRASLWSARPFRGLAVAMYKPSIRMSHASHARIQF